jgi:hypothetical protein
MHEMRWSQAERAIARKAFDRALQRELEEVMRKAREMAARIAEPSELWELEEFLSKRRREIDQKYDYRYSVLPMIFGILNRERRLKEEELRGLGEDKLGRIRACAKL